MISEILTSRVRIVIGSGLSMIATDLASAKLSSMLASAKIASMHATKLVATKVLAKAAALWMLIMSMIIPVQQRAPVVVQAPVAIHRHHHLPNKGIIAPVLPEVKEEAVEKPLFLHTFEKEYTFIFTGKVLCGQELCTTATVQVHVASNKNPNMLKTASIQPDGSYELSFLLKGSLHEHVDWWIVADSPDSASKQVQGREILTDDSNISIEQPISLL